MAKQLMQGGSRAIDAPCYPTQFGCDAAAAVHYPYDPAKAKQLLAEAGYPNGFDTELVTSDLPQWAGAMQGYLKAVGINAKIERAAGRRLRAAFARRAEPDGAWHPGAAIR